MNLTTKPFRCGKCGRLPNIHIHRHRTIQVECCGDIVKHEGKFLHHTMLEKDLAIAGKKWLELQNLAKYDA